MKTKILWLSDALHSTTGFCNQSKNILNRLQATNNYDCHSIGHHYLNQPLMPPIKMEDGETINVPIWPGSLTAPYALDRWQYYFEKIRPDIFTILLDTFMLYPHMLNVNIPTRSVFYFPSDGEYFPENCEHILRRINYPVAMSKFGQQQVKELFNMDVDYIPHGVDCYKHFYPVSDEHKKEIKTAWGLPEDAFIVGGVFRNQGRKNAPAMMKIFGRFFKQLTTEQQSKAFMILNADPLDPAAQADLRRVAQREGINHKVLWTGMKFSHGLTTNQLRELYNIFDINFSSTTGEGFGITTIEGMACKVPALITNYTTTKELVLDHNAGLPIDVNNEIVGTWNVERGFCDYVQGAEQLLTLYKDEGLRKELGINGRKAVEKYYDWDSVVIPEWDKLFKRIMK